MHHETGVVLVHGAWHTPSHFDNVVAHLEKNGYQVEAPLLASSSHTVCENAFHQDVAIVKAAIQRVTASAKDVVVIMHSYGGVCGSDAVAAFLEESKHMSQKSVGTISRLLYISAIIVLQGTMVLQEELTPHVLHIQDGLMHHLEPYHRFYNMTSPDIAFSAMKKLNPHNLSAFSTATNYQGWSAYGVPVTYLACKQDQALLYEFDQANFLQRLQAAGVDLTTYTLDSDHSPWLSAEADFMAYLNQTVEMSVTGS